MEPTRPLVSLRTLGLHDESAVRQAQRELALDDFDFAFDLDNATDWAKYVALQDRTSQGIDLVEGRVPATFFVVVVDGEIVGRSSVRHELNDYLRMFGGHIGYAIRPAFRRRGYATETLRQSLEFIRVKGVTEVLVTADDDNPWSWKIIEAQGGARDTDSIEPSGAIIRRYWINNQ
jgi:predicted acetyltransferase